jgi:DNA-directed RNA polymerase specialized sigma24 family protein
MGDDGDEELLRRIYPSLRRLAAVVGGGEIEPEDLLQEAVARALRLGSLSALEEPAAYLSRTIVNLASNSRRRFARRRWALSRMGAAFSAGSGPIAYPSDLSDLERLAPRERGAIYLHDVEGHPFEEVAALLGCSPDAARQSASRGRQRLRKLLKEDM